NRMVLNDKSTSKFIVIGIIPAINHAVGANPGVRLIRCQFLTGLFRKTGRQPGLPRDWQSGNFLNTTELIIDGIS
ncbi:hypothetical protein ACFL35_17090, partial [Candidatus Riflebacteria bacterium]